MFVVAGGVTLGCFAPDTAVEAEQGFAPDTAEAERGFTADTAVEAER